MILLTDIQLFGNVDYWSTLMSYDELVFEQYETFRKGTFLNRFYIATANGPLLLTVPLTHFGRNKSPIKELKISYSEPWEKIHWRSLTAAYNKSPWFDFYREDLFSIYNTKSKYFMDWFAKNLELMKKWLRKDWTVKMTEMFEKEIHSDFILDGRGAVNEKNNSLSPTGRTIKYHQVFEERNGFLPSMSVLDLLFCEGNRAVEILKNSSSD